MTPKSGGSSALPRSPLPFLRGLLYHRSFWMSGMVILAVGLSVRILCSSAGGDEGVEHNMVCVDMYVFVCIYSCIFVCLFRELRGAGCLPKGAESIFFQGGR